MLRTLLACAALVTLAALHGDPVCAEPVRATVKGAEAVNVRRGPGLETQAIVALHHGASVRVEERVGQWALVVLDSGERGYVNAAYLEIAEGAPIPTALPTGSLADASPAEMTPVPTATSLPPALDRELAALRERLASLESSMEQAGGSGRTPGAGESPPVVVPTVVEPPASLEVGPSLALAGVGFLIGFLFGTLYGQRQERNRRLRVRF